MKKILPISATCLAIALGSLSLSFSAQAHEIKKDDLKRFTAEQVFNLEYGDDPQISPDGRTIIYVRRSMDALKDVIRGDIWMLDTASGKHRPLVDGGSSAGAPRWSPDGSKFLYTTSANGKPELRVHFMDDGESFSLARLEAGPSGATWSPDGKTIAFSMFTLAKTPSFSKLPAAPKDADWSPPVRVFDNIRFRSDGAGYLKEGANHIYTVPVEGGTPRQVTEGEAGFGSPAWLSNDTLLGEGNEAEDRALDPIEREIYRINLEDLSRTALTSRDGPDRNPHVSPNGKLIAYTGFDDKVLSYQQTQLYVMNADGSNPRLLSGDFDRSIGAIAWDGNNKIVAQVDNAGAIDLVDFSLTGSSSIRISGLGGTAFGRPYGGASFSLSSGGIAAYTLGLSDRPAEIAVLEKGGEPRILTDLNADILPYLDLAPIEEIKVKSSHDGREIEAWVALPPNFEADGSFPMLMEIHGGPYAMYGPYFSAEIQRYAAEGYVTVYVNPRGSTGYGEDFAQLIDLNYPGEDFDDLMDISDALVERKYVSPERLFVTGGSGGGILTAWIVGHTDRFAAAASIKPVINWMTMALAADIAPLVKRHWIRANPWDDPDAFLERSPIMYVGNVETPTLLMVGEEDYRTPAWEAEQFYTALKLRNIDTALIRVPGSPHFIAGRPSRLIAKTDNIMGWFAKYDPEKQTEEGDEE
ncbi:S9 family peptidase [Hellea sp.]|nr:S9 family peptidase [Hellea sp.]